MSRFATESIQDVKISNEYAEGIIHKFQIRFVHQFMDVLPKEGLDIYNVHLPNFLSDFIFVPPFF